MTTTPIAPAAVAAVDPNASGAAGAASDGSAGGEAFLALVQALLDAGPVPQQPGAVAPAGDGAATRTTADDPDASDTAAELPGPLDPLLAPGGVPALVAGLVAPVAVTTPVAAPRSSTTTGPSTAPASDAADTVAGVAGVAGGSGGSESGAPALTLATPAAPAGPAAPAALAGVRALPAQPTATPQRVTTDADASIASTTASDPQPDRATGEATPATGASTGTTPTPTSSPASTPAPTAAVPIGPASAPAAAAPAPSSTTTNAVAHQVFPEVVRLTTSSDGPQRVTIRLNPESLGEVRVVLTQRQGSLEVSLSAGTEARRALAEGTPELQRLLDAVGRSDARIVVRDGTGLPVASSMPSAGTSGQPAQQSGAGTQWSTDLSGGAWSGAGHGGGEATPGHDRSTTPGSSNATDGIPDATAPSRRPATVTGARSGLDVTM